MRNPLPLLILSALLTTFGGCDSRSSQPQPVIEPSSTSTDAKKLADHNRVARQVKEFCGACHVVPHPEHFPRDAWREEVDQGYQLYVDSKRTDLYVPNKAEVLAYYESLAPARIEPLPGTSGLNAGGLSFDHLNSPDARDSVAIAHVNPLSLTDGQPEQLIFCDMRQGFVQAATIAPDKIEIVPIAKLKNPAHAEVCDLDGDHRLDLVVADLGSYLPSDHNRGRVVWLKRQSESMQFEPVVLAENLGRVCDVQPCDMDSDGDLDLVTAEFGWRTTGRVLVLENKGLTEGKPKFQLQVMDSRHGAIHVPTLDINRDGRSDFVAIFSQEHESVEAYVNEGSWKFHREPIFAADRPSFGSSGGSLTDLDGDGDTDVLYTNGDLFDDSLLRSYHAVHWLENQGSGKWVHHQLAELAGVHRALPADMDLDGDLDVVACAFIPDVLIQANGNKILDSAIWLEQTSTGVFERHVLEIGNCHHATMTVSDLDQDGDADLVMGNYLIASDRVLPSFVVWWNLASGTGRANSEQKTEAADSGS